MKIFLVFRKIGLLEKVFVVENCCLSCRRMLESKFHSTTRVRSFLLYLLFNCLHMHSFGNDGSQRARWAINLISMTKTTKIVPSMKAWKKYEFQCDLFAVVNGSGDKTNCKIFVNGPFDPEMHIACYCRAKKHVHVKTKTFFRWCMQLIVVEVVDIDMRVIFVKLLIITFPNSRLVIELMKWIFLLKSCLCSNESRVNRFIIEDNEVNVNDTLYDYSIIILNWTMMSWWHFEKYLTEKRIKFWTFPRSTSSFPSASSLNPSLCLFLFMSQ